MTINLHGVLLLVAFVVFFLAALGVPSRLNLIALGLAILVLTHLI